MTRIRAAAISALLSVAAAAALGGCGGDSEPAASGTPAPTTAAPSPSSETPKAAPTPRATKTPGPVLDLAVLEPAVQASYEKQLPGSTLSDVSCPPGLSPVKGSTLSCVLTTTGGAKGEATVRFTGSGAEDFTVTVSVAPTDLSSATIQSRIRADLAKDHPGRSVARLDCPGSFDLEVATFTDCRVDLDNGDQYIATVSRTDAGKLVIDYAAI